MPINLLDNLESIWHLKKLKKINLSLPQYTNCAASKSIWLQDLLRQTLSDIWVKNFAHGFT